MPRSRPARRLVPARRFVAGAAAVMFLAATSSSASASVAGPPVASLLPLLWAGRVVDHHGAGAVARVEAFVRPPASMIPAAGEMPAGSVEEGTASPLPSVPLATAVTGRDGRFSLRAARPAVPAGYAPDGWLHIMLWVEGEDGSWAIATDSVRYVAPGGALRNGAWLSSIPAAERVERLRAELTGSGAVRAAVEGLTAEELDGDGERPAVIELDPGRPASAAAAVGAPRAKLNAAWTRPGDPYTGCTARYVEERTKGMRTIADIDVGPHWSYKIDYDQTRTTAWDVGYERSGGQWKVAGSASFSNSSEGGFDAIYGPYGERFREAYQVELMHAKVLWQCGSKTSPGPFHVRTVEPESWTHGTYNQFDPVVGCKRGAEVPVAGNTYQWRKDGSISRYSAAAAVLGFSGQAAVTYSSAIRLGWKNHLGHPRSVCGESGDPYKARTRVTALD